MMITGAEVKASSVYKPSFRNTGSYISHHAKSTVSFIPHPPASKMTSSGAPPDGQPELVPL